MEKTIKKVARRDNYQFYSQIILIDLIRDSRPFRESCNTFYGHVTPSPSSRQIIDCCEMSCTSMAKVTLKTHRKGSQEILQVYFSVCLNSDELVKYFCHS